MRRQTLIANHESKRQPGSRALEAIAEAARRSREGARPGYSEPAPTHGSFHRARPASDVAVDVRSPSRAPSVPHRETHLVAAVVVVALVLIVVTVTLVVAEATRRPSRAAPRSVVTRTTTASPASSSASIRRTSVLPSTVPLSTVPPSPASTTSISATGGSDPLLSSLTPPAERQVNLW